MSKFVEPLIIIGKRNWTSSKIESIVEEHLKIDESNYFGNLLRFVFDKDGQSAQLIVCVGDSLYNLDDFKNTDTNYIINSVLKNPEVSECIPFIVNGKFTYWYSPDVSIANYGNDWYFDT